MSISLYVYVSICLYVYMSIRLDVHMSTMSIDIYTYVYMSICLYLLPIGIRPKVRHSNQATPAIGSHGSNSNPVVISYTIM